MAANKLRFPLQNFIAHHLSLYHIQLLMMNIIRVSVSRPTRYFRHAKRCALQNLPSTNGWSHTVSFRTHNNL